ncbi:uncharacterized protein [Eulemur rufifrons]|uniref:uncharacterized protein n=1 Tax=Eulemur rufifrons TaxID=859984 RepID=UPI003742486E
MGCGRRLCCIGGCAFRSAQPGLDPESERASPPSPPPLRPPRAGSSFRRDAFDPPSPGLRISGGEEFCLGPYEHLSAFLPLPSRLPHPVGARARTRTHTRRRACARPRAPSRGVSSAPQQIPALSGAATHTGFQPPRGVLCLRRRRRRRWRERRLQPGPVSQLLARDRVREKPRRGRTPRLGGAAPRPAPGSARRAVSALHTAALGFHPSALHPFSSLPRRTPLWCGPETFLSALSALDTIVVICECPLSRELGHLGQVFLGGNAPCPAQPEAKGAVGS